MDKAHQSQKKPAHSKNATNSLAAQKEINTNSKEQTPVKAVLKPIWSLGIQLWGTVSNNNVVL
jgi:hypothetical protein